ncbi:FadR/GntR family transcriptional regulator [Tropicimonas sp. IMCC6043]|uniref:FadR/GntR family transcriptional regulator n=1 Tax=Tropicimonas sp. IMCC6043 TaxID=2510645 RepID=UPI00101D35F1|nr:FadR/GntR family transcriptional regulator [Tropicimonas sp. IMCC6043]RYH07791.1 FadR family transcriptional regulator [Tropicimonas sp. IMCC6043]
MAEKLQKGTGSTPPAATIAADGPNRAGRSVYRMVVETVARDVVSGRYGPGEILPTEAVLGEQLGAGRSSVREAMRVLVDKGMLEIRTRTGARVTDRDTWRSLDPDVVRWTLDLRPDHKFLADLLEARRIMEPQAAALAAHRATASDLSRMESALHAMTTALPGDIDSCVEADAAFHQSILAASDNLVLREFEIIIDAALRTAFRLSTSLAQSYSATIHSHNDVFEAIRLRDPVRAMSSMSLLLDVAAADLGLPNGIVGAG